MNFTFSSAGYDIISSFLCNEPEGVCVSTGSCRAGGKVGSACLSSWCAPSGTQTQAGFLGLLNSQQIPETHFHVRAPNFCQLIQLKIEQPGASLVVQWLRIRLPMQGTRVRALVWEDPTCCGATGPVSHNYWACVSGACAPQQERPRQWEARAPRWRVAPACRN